MVSAFDEAWLERLRRSLGEPIEGLPGWPSSTTQRVFVGASGEAALLEAFRFFLFVRDSAGGLKSSSQVLDFGVGWGRIIRCFSRDVSSQNLHGVDVDPEVLDEARRTGVRGDLRLIKNTGKLPYPDRSLDVAYAFSVFSHLSENSAQHWLNELMRVLKPGAVLVFTSTDLRFLKLCKACQDKKTDRNEYEDHYAKLFEDPDRAIAAYLSGEHVHVGNGGRSEVLDKSFYGWSAVPLGWIKKTIGMYAQSIEFRDDSTFEQAIFVVKKMPTVHLFGRMGVNVYRRLSHR
jgi:SAM-dependent methyltransferase